MACVPVDTQCVAMWGACVAMWGAWCMYVLVLPVAAAVSRTSASKTTHVASATMAGAGVDAASGIWPSGTAGSEAWHWGVGSAAWGVGCLLLSPVSEAGSMLQGERGDCGTTTILLTGSERVQAGGGGTRQSRVEWSG